MTRPSLSRYLARYILLDDRVIEGGALDVRGTRIEAIHERAPLDHDPHVQRVDLAHHALVPGLVNAHSHAFQRAIRGATEYLHRDRTSEDFWSWRRAMYDAALGAAPDQFERASRRAYWEMALSGITSVGEFHYVHHDRDGRPYEGDPHTLARRAIDAAREAGLRVNLLRVAYHRAGFDRPTDPMQRRFTEPSVEHYLAQLDSLADLVRDQPRVQVAPAPHSIRAVPRDWLERIGQWALDHDTPLHIHASEQRAEIQACLAEHGCSPVELLAETRCLGPHTTLVHATHASPRDIALIASHDAIVCACPSTERNLGDGFLPALPMMRARVPICLGSDSHTTIDLWDEMRLVEYHERLRYERRNVLSGAWSSWEMPDRERQDVSWLLLPMASRHGARSLGIAHQTGSLATGLEADMVALDLDHPALYGASALTLPAHIALSMSTGAVDHVWVAGDPIVQNRRHVTLDREALER